MDSPSLDSLAGAAPAALVGRIVTYI